ncbi:MAG: ABC transporter permease subunit [Thermodesulfobacteriota bacterium]|nr:ABC transporter permease subunit [Thermodesulfobacteriota bacterium]
MSKIFLIAWITFKDSIRNRALYGIFLLGLVLFTANIIITGMFAWELGKVAVDVGLSVVSFSGLVIIFFLSINVVSNDMDRKTIYLILSRPITKFHYIVGKYVGLSLVILLSSSVLGLCAALSVKVATYKVEVYIPAHFSWTVFFLGLVFLTLSLLVVLAMALLWVSITTHPFTAVLLSILSYLIGHNVENVKNIISTSKMFAENPMLTRLTDFASWIFPNLAAFDLKTTAAYGLQVRAGYLTWVAIYGVSYIGICLVLTILIFQRRELA